MSKHDKNKNKPEVKRKFDDADKLIGTQGLSGPQRKLLRLSHQNDIDHLENTIGNELLNSIQALLTQRGLPENDLTLLDTVTHRDFPIHVTQSLVTDIKQLPVKRPLHELYARFCLLVLNRFKNYVETMDPELRKYIAKQVAIFLNTSQESDSPRSVVTDEERSLLRSVFRGDGPGQQEPGSVLDPDAP